MSASSGSKFARLSYCSAAFLVSFAVWAWIAAISDISFNGRFRLRSFAVRFGVHGKTTLLLDILGGCIDAYVVAEFRVLSPQHAVGTGEFCNPAQRVRS